MNLRQAEYAIEAATVEGHERAMLKAQMAIGYALIAIAEKLDKMATTQALALEHSKDLYTLPSN